MDYRIVEKPSFSVVGKALRVGTKDGENMRRIPQFWAECHDDGTNQRLWGIALNGSVLGNVMLGISMDFAPDMSEFTYMIGAEGTAADAVDGLEERSIPALSWAVFKADGAMPEAIQNAWSGIWSEFLPKEPYAHADGPDMELYPPGDPMSADYVSEVWVPVVRK